MSAIGKAVLYSTNVALVFVQEAVGNLVKLGNVSGGIFQFMTHRLCPRYCLQVCALVYERWILQQVASRLRMKSMLHMFYDSSIKSSAHLQSRRGAMVHF